MKVITAQYAGMCLTCEEDYDIGEKVYWEPGVGCWHTDCDVPRNLQAEQRTTAERQRLGLEPYEFGTAPMPKEHD